MKKICIAAVLFTFLAGAQHEAFSMDHFGEDDAYLVVNRPVDIQGLTGLLFTNSAYTQPQGSITFGLSGIGEDSDIPNYSIAQVGASITLGITDRLELGIKGKTIATNLGSSETRETGMGDTDLLLKWRFSSQGEILPALAFGLGWKFPTGDTEKGFSEVKHEGVKIMVLATGENRVLDDGFFGLYLEAQAVFDDITDKVGGSEYKDKYGVLNAGILFPISDDNRMQLMVEYNAVVKKDVVTLTEGNYTAVTPGLRYVTDDFNISLGVQLMRREHDPALADSANRLVGTMSYRF